MWECICCCRRYATEGGTREAAIAAGLHGLELENGVARIKARTRMYAPGGPMAVELSKNPTVLVVNDTVFAHGGVTPEHGVPAALRHRFLFDSPVGAGILLSNRACL